MPESKNNIISRLQKDILQWQGFASPQGDVARGIGLGPLESAFPNGVFPTGTIHEMICPTPEQAASTVGLLGGLLSILMKQGGACLWISLSPEAFPAIIGFFWRRTRKGNICRLAAGKDLLWAMEEALKCKGLAAVVAEVRDITFAQSRRLQLAVESSKVTGFLLRNDPKKLSSTICVARWQVTPLPCEVDDGFPGVGFPRWQIELLRVRNGTPGAWKLEWTDGQFITVEEQVMEFNTPQRRIAV